MDRTSKILIALCFVLIVIWGPVSRMIWPPRELPPSAAPRGQTGTNEVVRTPSLREAQAASLAPTPVPAPTVARLQELPAEKVDSAVLENEDMTVHFSAKGGGIHQVIFKKFEVPNEPPATINDQTPTGTLDLENVGGVEFGSSYTLEVSQAEKRVTATQSAGEIGIVKTFWLKDGYQIHAQVSLTNKSAKPIVSVEQPVEVTAIVEKDGRKQADTRIVKPASLAIGTASPLTHLDSGSDLGFEWLWTKDKHSTGGLYSVTDKPWYAFWQTPLYKHFYKTFPRPAAPKGDEPALKPEDANMQWIAVKNQFFTLVVTPTDHTFVAIHADAIPLRRSERAYSLKDQKGIFVSADLSRLQLEPGTEKTLNYDIYAGPKEYQALAALGKQQELIMSYGWWTAICKALLWMMTLFHGWIGNWGVSIIAMTVVIKLVFWPLTNASTRSMKKMSALAPKLKELQEKYPDDMEKRNVETMKLYREYGVNPFGGCLPMLVQIPIFIALFTMLRSMVQLRGASFLWIDDLSMPDTVARIPFPEMHLLWWDLGPIPVNPMPILMMIANIWQMRLTPTTITDKSQKMMMWMMPFVFFFICYNFSSALALYWTVQTLLQAGQTYLIQGKGDVQLEKVKRPQASGGGGGFSFARPVENKKKKK